MSEALVEAYLDALKSMRDGSPKPLVKRAHAHRRGPGRAR